jgi:hypothetical protein
MVLLAAISPTEVVPTLAIISILYLLLVFFFILLFRSPGQRLIGLGLLTAVLSVWCAQMPGEGGVSVQVGQGATGALGRAVAGSDATGTLGRIAVLLILCGLVVMFLSHLGYSAKTAQKEETSRANPV